MNRKTNTSNTELNQLAKDYKKLTEYQKNNFLLLLSYQEKDRNKPLILAQVNLSKA